LKRNLKTLFILSLSILFTSCLGTRFLKDGEYLLFKQKIVTKSKTDLSDLETHFNQKPNRRFPVIPFSPYVSFYEWGIKRYQKDSLIAERQVLEKKFNADLEATKSKPDKQKKIIRKRNRKLGKLDKQIDEGNVLMRWGEPLAIYNDELRLKSNGQMQSALNNRGFFDAKVDSKVKYVRKRAKVKYFVEPGRPHQIDTVFIVTTDSLIYKLIESSASKTVLKKGQNYDQAKIGLERDRIDNLLKDNGYYDFSKQYVSFDIDTALGNKMVAIRMRIANPAKRGYHKIFKVDSVIFVTDANISLGQGVKRTSQVFDNITYLYFEDSYAKKVLGRRVFIKKDSIYSRENTFATQRQIANLDIFKFVNINYDTTGGRFIANVFTSPLQKFQTSNEVGMNVSQGLPGPFYNLTFKDRNVFKGLEILELNFRAGIEGVASAASESSVYRSQELGSNLSLTMPQFFLPFSDRLNLKLGEVNPKTRFQVGYSYTNRPDFKQRTSKASITYSWQNKRDHLYTFSPSEISLTNSDLTDSYRSFLITLLNKGNNLIRTFDPSFVSSMHVSGVYNFGKYGAVRAKSSYLRLFLESGGTFNDFSEEPLLKKYDIVHYRFFKFNADFRRNYPVDAYNTIAFRINGGFARPYGKLNVLPYQKYFFAGGSNSVRAWAPRRLGPGSSKPSTLLANGEFDYEIEQPGEIILETSLEFRRNIFGFIDGALFVDAGNVWAFSDLGKEGALFEIDDFYNEIAVGTGLGLRFDFSFLIIRTDFAFKMFDPAQDLGQRWVGDQINLNLNSNFGPVLNIGIGYPF